MGITKVLKEGGFVPLQIPHQEGDKVGLYYLKDLTSEKVEKAKAAIQQQQNYQGDLKSFEKDIRDKPYLLREGKTLQLISGEAEKIPEKGISHHIQISNQSSHVFESTVKIGRNFKITGENPNINK